MQAEREASVRSALASLPRHEQLVAALFYGCGYSYNEVSAFLKIPITTVKKRLHSARQKLRMQLQATLRDEIEHVNARPASNNEAAEIEEIAVRVTRLFKRGCSHIRKGSFLANEQQFTLQTLVLARHGVKEHRQHFTRRRCNEQ